MLNITYKAVVASYLGDHSPDYVLHSLDILLVAVHVDNYQDRLRQRNHCLEVLDGPWIPVWQA